MAEKIKERIRENLRRHQEGKKEASVHSADIPDSTGGLTFVSLIKKIPILGYLTERFFGPARKQTGTPESHIGRGDIAVDRMVGSDYGIFVQMLRNEGFKGKIKGYIFKVIGFYAWWQSQINREMLKLIEDAKKQINTLYQNDDEIRGMAHVALQNDDEIRGMAHVALEKTEGFQNSLDSATGKIFETINELNENIKHLHQIYRDDIANLQVSLGSLSVKTNELVKEVEGYRMESAYLDKKLGIINYELKRHGALKSDDLIRDLPRIDLDGIRYLSFENKYRGSRSDIKKRQKQYLEFVLKAGDNSKGNFILDVGCGRGEFLELMADNGIPAKGIDTNEGMIETCKNMGLDVHREDALRFMNTIPDNCLIGVTAFQVVEHLPVEYLREFIKSCFYKIKDNGVVILETVNPYSFVAMKYFWMDLSHVRPIPPETLKFLVDMAGFRNIEVKFSTPVPENLTLKGSDYNTKLLNDLLFGYQDYAVIGWK